MPIVIENEKLEKIEISSEQINTPEFDFGKFLHKNSARSVTIRREKIENLSIRWVSLYYLMIQECQIKSVDIGGAIVSEMDMYDNQIEILNIEECSFMFHSFYRNCIDNAKISKSTIRTFSIVGAFFKNFKVYMSHMLNGNFSSNNASCFEMVQSDFRKVDFLNNEFIDHVAFSSCFLFYSRFSNNKIKSKETSELTVCKDPFSEMGFVNCSIMRELNNFKYISGIDKC